MKELFLVRHAIAVPRGSPRYPSDDRPLTAEGIAKMERVAAGIAKLLSHPDLILTSPLKRARHTAAIIAGAMHAEKKVRTVEELLPGAPEADLLNVLARAASKSKIMLVGHEPGLSRFASRLLGSPRAAIIEFKKGAMCRIDVSSIPPKRPGVLIFHLSPKHLRALAK